MIRDWHQAFEDPRRRFEPFVERCLYCPTAAIWTVTEKDSDERILTCDDHKFTAFS